MTKKIKKRVLFGLGSALGISLIAAVGCADLTPEKNPDAELINVINGFEDEKSVGLFEAGAGTEISLNRDGKYVHGGKQSLRLDFSSVPTPRFAFSENIVQTDISEYEYISFWIYNAYHLPVSLANTADYETYDAAGNVTSRRYLVDEIQPYTWTKVKIEAGTTMFRNMQYFLPFNDFVLGGTGEDYNKTIEYSVYIDDVRIWKQGMSGEADLIAVDKDGADLASIPEGTVGKVYTLPDILAFGPDGAEIIGADIVKTVYDPEGKEVSLLQNSFRTDQAGTYTFEYSLEYLGIENSVTAPFEMRFAEEEDIVLGQAVVNKDYSVPVPRCFIPDTQTEAEDVQVSFELTDPSGSAVSAAGGIFTPREAGEYTVTYLFRQSRGEVLNEKTVSRSLWVTAFEGLIADFESGEQAMVQRSPLSPDLSVECVSDGVSKLSAQGGGKSLSIKVTDDMYPMFRFTESFPYKNLDGFEYLSFWVFNGYGRDVRISYSESGAQPQLLRSGNWTRVKFASDQLNADCDFRTGEFLMYEDGETTNHISGTFYLDDIRIFREGFAEEVDFSEAITTSDYDEESGQGVRFAMNTEYEADLRVYTQSGEPIGRTATLNSVTDSRGELVLQGDKFVPQREGLHTLVVTYLKDGILNSATKTFYVRPQMELSPDKEILLPYGEAGITYTFTEKPILWNHGVINDEIPVQITVTSPKGTAMAVKDGSFVPTEKGRYNVSYVAIDPQNPSAVAVYSATVGIFANGKKGVIADFEDDDLSQIESDKYAYGSVSKFTISTERAASGEKSAKFSSTSDATVNPEFFLTKDNIAGNISQAKYFSFKVYIEDMANPDRVYTVSKVSYYNFENEWNDKLQVGLLNQKIPANRWVEVRIEREDFETVLGGTIFAGSNLQYGGAYWAEGNNDYITCFQFQYFDENGVACPVGKINLYLDDIVLGL